MSAHGHSEACCSVPPVVASGYQAKGSYEQIGGMRTYVTGPADATKAIVVIFDIFGFFDQTLQGVDIIAHNDKEKYRVYMPDWFGGKPCPIEIFPPSTKEQESQLNEFFTTYNPKEVVAPKVPGFVKAVKESNSNLSSFGIIGYCWGGKVTILSTIAEGSPFSAAAIVHPAMIEPEEATKIKVPFAFLASNGENKEEVDAFESKLTVPHLVKWYDQIHGWMAARSDLSDPNVKEAYESGYKKLLHFFTENF